MQPENRYKTNLNQQQNINELSRFGHSVTLLNANNTILFGGAKGYSSNYEIKNDCYIFKIKENTWLKLAPDGEIPSARAAHASCAINEHHLAIFGGAGINGVLATDDIFILEVFLEENLCRWHKIISSDGNSPGKRYGHTMTYFKPFLLIFGGNLGNSLTNKVFIAQVDENNLFLPLKWGVLQTTENSPTPPPRMYHACSICKYGGALNMIIAFGGRSEKGEPLNDCWGLRKHRNGTWDWVVAPYEDNYQPRPRYQHTVTFYYNFLIIIGGRNNFDVRQIPIEIYDTQTSKWVSVAFFNKFRHTTWIVENSIYTHGGFQLTNTMISTNDIIKVDLLKLFHSNEDLKVKFLELQKFLEEEKIKKQKEQEKNNINNNNKRLNSKNKNKIDKKATIEKHREIKIADRPLIQKVGEIAMVTNNKDDKLVIKTVQFDDKWSIKNTLILDPKSKTMCDLFLEYLLKPESWLKDLNNRAKEKFYFSIDQIASLTKQCMDIVAKQPNILKISVPVKVFGDIHGQYLDLMNFFEKWKCPNETANGDILANDYLFLGDYVDRGNLSLETICLLMALKVKYPDQIHLIRGNHEDILINSGFGFQEECERRLDDDSESDDSLFALINNFFEFLPFAAVIEDQILCVHGGIGSNVKKISDIDSIPRPFTVIHEAQTREQKLAMDLLWSDPTDTDEEMGIQPNKARDSNDLGHIVKFGPDVVRSFLKNNNLSHIIRGHECVLDGFERFAGGLLLTIFSATDYCGRHGNAGAMLVINQHMQMIPHLIYPPDGGNNNWIEDEEYYKARPPTPPRVRCNKPSY